MVAYISCPLAMSSTTRQRIFPLGYRSNDNNNKVVNQRIGQSDTIARFMEIGLTVVVRISRINVIPIPNSRICISFRPSRSIKIYSGICVPSERLSRGEKQAKVSKSVRFGSVRFGSVRSDSVRFGLIRFGSVRIRSARNVRIVREDNVDYLYLEIDAQPPFENQLHRVQNGF